MIVAALALIVVLGVLIFVHELGHFVAAKWAGVFVHRFSLGIGPPVKALSFRRGETEYAISWLPLGGYVKMASAEEEAMLASLEGGRPHEPVPADRLFEAKPLWKRMIIMVAGVTMNMLFAWVVYAGLALHAGKVSNLETRVGLVDSTAVPAGAEALRTLAAGDRIVRINGDSVDSWNAVLDRIQNAGGPSLDIALAGGRQVSLAIPADAVGERLKASAALAPWRSAVLDSVVPDRAAGLAGLRAGDSVVAINGQPVRQWYDLTRMVEALPHQPIAVQVVRAGTLHEFRFVTDSQVVLDTLGSSRVVGLLGVTSQLHFRHDPLSLGGAITGGWQQTAGAVQQIGRTVKGMVRGHVAGRELGGPLLIGQLAGQSARMGIEVFLAFMALISVNLAVLNFLPIPLLDGGQFVFLLAEGILRKPLPLKVRETASMVGFVLLILLMVFAFSNDLRRIFGGILGG